MDARIGLVAALVVLVALAGCSSLTGDAGEGSVEVTAEGYDDESNVTDGDAAATSYREALYEAGSYAGEYEYVVESDGGDEVVLETAYEVDFDEEAGIQSVAYDTGRAETNAETYYDGDTRYLRTAVDGETDSVDSASEPFPREDLTPSEAIEPLLTNATDYETSTEERDGTSVVRYETTDVEGLDSFLGVDEYDEARSFEATFWVDADGVVREADVELSYLLDGEEWTVSMAFDLTDIGGTSVERPEWTDEA